MKRQLYNVIKVLLILSFATPAWSFDKSSLPKKLIPQQKVLSGLSPFIFPEGIVPVGSSKTFTDPKSKKTYLMTPIQHKSSGSVGWLNESTGSITWLDRNKVQALQIEKQKKILNATLNATDEFNKKSGSKDPIPANKSLVPTGATSVRSSGNSPSNKYDFIGNRFEKTSGAAKNIFEMTPSQLDHVLRQKLGQGSAQQIKSKLIEFIKNEQTTTSAQKLENLKKAVGQIPFQGASDFAKTTGSLVAMQYLFMGMVAAYNCILKTETHPMACEQYAHTLTDPVGIMMSVGFAAAMYPVIKILRGAKQPGFKGITKLFAGTVLFTTIYASASYIMQDTDAIRCLGLDMNRWNNGQPRDLQACDRFWSKLQSDGFLGVMEQSVPSLARLVASIALGQTLMHVSTKVMQTWIASRKTQAIASAARYGKVWGFVASTALFAIAYEGVEAVTGIEQNLKERQVRNKISEQQKSLINNWQLLSRQNWDISSSEIETKCLHQRDFSCAPKVFQNIQNFKFLMNQWRNVRLNAFNASAQEWAEKIRGFYSFHDQSKELYDNLFLELENNPELDIKSWFELQKHKYSESFKQWEPYYSKDIWHPMFTPKNFVQYNYYSMACGPEIELNTGARGAKIWAHRFVDGTRTSSLNSSGIQNVADQSLGHATLFLPPKITIPTKGNSSICLDPNFKFSLLELNPGFYDDHDNLYKNVGEYIEKNIRESVFNKRTMTNNFQQWWSQNVDIQLSNYYSQEKVQFQKMLEEHFFPALTEPSVSCEAKANLPVTSMGDIPAKSYITIAGKLGQSINNACDVRIFNKLANGILQSNIDETMSYLFLLMPLVEKYKKSQGDNAQTVQLQLQEKVENILVPILQMQTLSSLKSQNHRLDTRNLEKQLNQSIGDLREYILGSEKMFKPYSDLSNEEIMIRYLTENIRTSAYESLKMHFQVRALDY